MDQQHHRAYGRRIRLFVAIAVGTVVLGGTTAALAGGTPDSKHRGVDTPRELLEHPTTSATVASTSPPTVDEDHAAGDDAQAHDHTARENEIDHEHEVENEQEDQVENEHEPEVDNEIEHATVTTLAPHDNSGPSQNWGPGSLDGGHSGDNSGPGSVDSGDSGSDYGGSGRG